MSSGKYASLQQLRPLEGDISTDILNREDQQFKYREEKRIQDALTKKEVDELAAKKAKQGKAYSDGLDKIKLNESGVRSYDERNIDAYTRKGGVKDTYDQLFSRLEKDPMDKEAIAGVKNLENFATDVNEMSNGILAYKQTIDKGIADGTLSPSLNKDIKEKIDKMVSEKSYRWGIGKDFSVNLINEGYDKNKDGKIDEEDKLTKQDIIDLNQLGGIKKFDARTFATETKAELGKLSKKTDGTNYVGFDMSKVGDLTAKIDRIMGADLATMTNEGKSLISDWNKANWEDVTQEQFKAYKAQLAQNVINSYDTTNDKTTDYQGLNYGLAVKRENREQAKVDKDNNANSASMFTLNVDEKGRELKVVKDYGGIKKGMSQFPIAKSDRKSIIVDGKYIQVDALYLDNKTGKVSYSGIEQTQDPVTGIWTNTNIKSNGSLTANGTVAKELGYDVEELSNELKTVRSEKLNGGFSADEEKLINDNLEVNPGYTREEIISALNLKK